MTAKPHWTFSINPRAKGTYRRRLDDIAEALTKFQTEKLPPNSAAQFVAYYFGCEKLAKGIVGINRGRSANRAYNEEMDPAAIEKAAGDLQLKISTAELQLLFRKEPKSNKKPSVARGIRDRIFHDFGPTNVCHAVQHASSLIPIMKKFLSCERQVQHHLHRLNSSRQIENPPAQALKK
jgi:hypothetical protein